MPRNEPWAEKWEKLDELGKGGQGVTFRAKSRADSDLVGVLKLLKNTTSPQARRRMAREVVHLATVHQAGGRVPRVLDHNASTDTVADTKVPLYLTMELIEGDTLRQLVDRSGPLPLPEAISIAVDICFTIQIAHAENVLHRDLKPENLVVNGSKKAFILDYGLSFNDHTDDIDDLTRTDEGLGNKFLILPEHSFGRDQRHRCSDLTAVAALFYFCLTGAIPGVLRDEHGRMPHERNREALEFIMAIDPTTSHQLRTFFTKAFAHELGLRFQTVDELSSRLSELGQRRTASAPEDPIAVAIRAKELLHRHSRPTILANFSGKANKITTEINKLVNSMVKRLQEQEVSLTTIGLGGHKLPDGVDQVFGGPVVCLQLHHHPYQIGLQILVGASGNECVVYRAYYEGKAGTLKPAQLDETLRYPGTEEPPVALIVQDVSTQIARLIDELVRLAFGGEVPT